MHKSNKSEAVNYLLANRVIVMRKMSCFKFHCFVCFLFCIYTAHVYPSLSDFYNIFKIPLNFHYVIINNFSGRSRGGARGDLVPSLLLDQTEARRAE